jgi:hypothetical protein
VSLTCRPQPRAGHEAMAIGIPEFRDAAECNTLAGMLAIPFRKVMEPRREGG